MVALESSHLGRTRLNEGAGEGWGIVPLEERKDACGEKNPRR